MLSSRDILGACKVQRALIRHLVRIGAPRDRIRDEVISHEKLCRDYEDAYMTERYIAEANE